MTKAPGRKRRTDDTHWAVTECADAALGDVRRPRRLVELAGVLAQHPTAALPDAIEPQDVLLRHREATYGRLSKAPLGLAVQDTTDVDWTAHPATQGLEPLGHTAWHGLLVHRTLALTPERVPVGRVAQPVRARDPVDIGKRARRKRLPLSQQESQQWLASLNAVFSAR